MTTDIVCLGLGLWSPPWMPVHQVMKRLAAHYRVIFVEAPSSDFRELSVARAIKRMGLVNQVEDNLYVVSPPPGLPFKRMFRPFNRATGLILARALRHVVSRFKLQNVMLWITWPTQVDYVDIFRPNRVVYYLADELLEVALGRKNLVAKMDDEIIARADLVIAASNEVYQSRLPKAKRIALVPNGVDFAHFVATANDADMPIDLAPLPRPIIGFSGSVDHRLDLELMVHLAQAYSTASIVLFGPKRRDIDDILCYPNVHYLGSKTTVEVPAYLAALDVGLIPYRLTQYTKALSPLKLLEYMSVGLPVVSTPIPACESVPHVLIARSGNDLVRAVARALEEDCDALRRSRQLYASQHTWDRRVREIVELLRDLDRAYQPGSPGEEVSSGTIESRACDGGSNNDSLLF